MSREIGKKIKIIAVIIGVLGSLSGLAMAFVNLNASSVINVIAWLFIAIAFLVLIIPVYAVGNIIMDMSEQRQTMQKMSDRISNLAVALTKDSPADRFKPVDHTRTVTTQRKQVFTTKAASSNAEDFTRSLSSSTLMDVEPEIKKANTFSNPYDQTDTTTLNISPSPTLKNVFTKTEAIPAQMFETKAKPVTSTFSNTFATAARISQAKCKTIAAGGLHSVYISSSGKVVAAGNHQYNQCNVDGWRNISSVAAGNHHTIGLLFNGTCVATGYNGYDQCKVGEWSNVVSVTAGFNHTVALLENGTCVATGDNAYGQCNVSDWTEIVAVSAGNNYTVGLKSDGTIVAVGANTDGQWTAARWSGIAEVASGSFHTIGLKNDGTCVAVGNNSNEQCEVNKWKDVRSVAAGTYHTVALLSNGTCIATGYNGYGQCEVSKWQGIVEIAAGRNHTIGITADGIILTAGDNEYGQCDTLPTFRVKIPKK